jgi:hypothetical protein
MTLSNVKQTSRKAYKIKAGQKALAFAGSVIVIKRPNPSKNWRNLP